MSTRITQPAQPLDGMSPGDTVLAHTPEAAEAYRAAAANAMQRQAAGLPPEGSPAARQPAAPSEAPLPMTGVARAVAGREIQRLKAMADQARRDLAGRFTFTASGFQVSDPGVLAQRAELAAQADAAEAEAARLDSLDDDAVRRYAAARGVR